MIPKLLFAYFAVMILGLSWLAVNARNPVHSVLMVLGMFFHLAGVYLTLNAEFLAAVQVIVYAGAILVLYVFVVFLVNLRAEIRVERFVGSRWVPAALAAGLFALIAVMVNSFAIGPPGVWTIEAVEKTTHTKALGFTLFSRYYLPFEIAGIVLLVAVVGGIVLAKREPADTPVEGEDPARNLKGEAAWKR